MINTATKTILLSAAILLFSVIGTLSQTRLSTGKWKLTEALGRPVTNSSAYIQFGDELLDFSGNTGCNQMFGKAEIDGNRIELSSIGMTKRLCKLMTGNVVESVYVKALGDASRYRRTGNRLDLTDRRGRVLLRFKLDTQSNAASQLDSKKWMLESIGQRKTLVALNGIFLAFDKEKESAGGNTGCNVFGGSYKAAGKSLKITNVISTMRACLEDGKMQTEREFLDGLRNTARYEIIGNRLMLYDGSRLLLTFRGEAK